MGVDEGIKLSVEYERKDQMRTVRENPRLKDGGVLLHQCGVQPAVVENGRVACRG